MKFIKKLYKVINSKHFYPTLAFIYALEILIFAIAGMLTPLILTMITSSIIIVLLSWALISVGNKLKDGGKTND